MADTVNLSFERATRANDNRLVSPADLLREALADIERGEEAPSSAMVLFWERDHETGAISTPHYASNLSGSERIALLEMVKAQILREMGLT